MSSSSINCCVEMDVDGPPGGQLNGAPTLKRCSSAPMINESNTVMTQATPNHTQQREQQNFNLFGNGAQTRTRRFSASFSPVPGSPISAPKFPSRIAQLRQEENADRELAQEREINQSMQISQSWEDLTIVTESHDKHHQSATPPTHKFAPLTVHLPSNYYTASSSPSPTRPGFQSPTRSRPVFVRRSASPVMRPSTLTTGGGGVKRKLDADELSTLKNELVPRNKRFHSYSGRVERPLGLLAAAPSPLGAAESARAPPPEPMCVAKNEHDS